MYKEILYTLILFAIIYIIVKISDKTHNRPNPIKYNFIFIWFYISLAISAMLVLPICLIRGRNVLNGIQKHELKLHQHANLSFSRDLYSAVSKHLEFELRNGHILAEDRGAVIIANHRSSLDSFGFFNIWHVIKKLSVVAKKSILYAGPFGLLAYFYDTVFIDRSNRKYAYKQLEETSKLLVKNKTKLLMFPEGTRNRTDANLLPFKKGAFNTAIAAQVPIIPVVFSPYYFINENRKIFNKGKIIILCLEPVPTTGLTLDDVPDLTNRLTQIMSDAYDNLSLEVKNALPPQGPEA